MMANRILELAEEYTEARMRHADASIAWGELQAEVERLNNRIENLKIEVNQAAATAVYEIPGHPRWGR